MGIIERIDSDQVVEPTLPWLATNGGAKAAVLASAQTHTAPGDGFTFHLQEDAPLCAECGALMIRNGACYKCLNCGATSGCS